MYYFFYVEKYVFLLPLMAEIKQENLPAAGVAGLCSSSHIKSPGNTCVFHYKITYLELLPYMFKKKKLSNTEITLNLKRITLKRLAQSGFLLEFALFAVSDCTPP